MYTARDWPVSFQTKRTGDDGRFFIPGLPRPRGLPQEFGGRATTASAERAAGGGGSGPGTRGGEGPCKGPTRRAHGQRGAALA